MRKLFAAAASFAFVAVSAGSAQACDSTGAQQVFLPWGDLSSYVLAPDGGFEAGATGWSLSGGAVTVRDNESFYLHGSGDKRSLSLPGGSSAASPSICMAVDTPSFRLLARNLGDPSSTLRVEAVYELLGALDTTVVSDVTAGPEWAPTQQMSTILTLSTLAGTVSPSAIQVRIRPLDNRGKWRIDDLYVDPFARH